MTISRSGVLEDPADAALKVAKMDRYRLSDVGSALATRVGCSRAASSTLMPNIDSAGARIFKSYWYALGPPRHLYLFSPKSLRNLANSVGLQEVPVTTHRELFIEPSVCYVLDDIFRKMGI
jgi:hypothetical protein